MYMTDAGEAALPHRLAGQATPSLASLVGADGEGSDPLALARGIGLALIISVAFWVMLSGTIFWLLPLATTT